MKKILGALLLLGLSGLLWWALDPGRRDPGADGVAPVVADGDSPARTALAPGQSEPPDADVDARPDAAPPGERNAVEIAPAWREIPHTEGGLLLRVVHAESRTPVPGAEVRFLDDSTDDIGALLRDLGRGSHYVDAIERYGTRFLSDEAGEVRVPFFVRGADVLARRGELFGLRSLGPREYEPVLIEVWPAVHLRARVVDASGQPRAGVPVALRQYFWDQRFDFLTLESDRDGLVEFRHIDALLARGAASAESAVALAGLLTRPVEVDLDRGDLPLEPVELVLPSVGEVEVLLVDADGELVTGEVFEVTLEAFPADSRSRFSPVRIVDGSMGQVVSAGRARFTTIGLGQELRARVTRPAGGTSYQGYGPSPASDGERVSLPVEISGRDPLFTGRLLDPAGRPLARRGVGYTLDDPYVPEASLPGGRLRTDAEGRFEFLLAAEQVFGERPVTRVELHCASGGGGRVLGALVGLGADPHPELNALGDIEMRLPPRLVAGRAQDSSGAPVPYALVSLETGSLRGLGAGIPVPSFRPALEDSAVRTAKDGSFEFFAAIDDPMRSVQLLRLDCEGRYHSLPEPVEVRVGSSSVVLILQDKGRIAGSLVLPPGIRSTAVSVARTTRDPDTWEALRPDTSGAFTWDAVTPGSYDVKIELDDQPAPVLFVRGVRVQAGQTIENPRLQRVDLRERIRRVELTVVDGEGELIVPVEIAALAPGGERYWHRRAENGKLQFLCSEPLDLAITSPGYRVARLRDVTGDRTVTLEPGAPIRLSLTPRFQLPEGYRFRAELLPRDNPTIAIHAAGPGIPFDENGEADGCVSHGGAWTVILQLQRGNGAASYSRRLRCTPTGIQIPDEGGVFVLSLDAAEVRGMLE